MNRVMISLIGEQPLPNLLPIRFEKPEDVVFAYTGRTDRARGTKEVSSRLEMLLSKETRVYPFEVRPFDVAGTQQLLEKFILGRGWKPEELVFNLTGGTKAMAFAAYSLAEEWGCTFVYLQSEESFFLHRYGFDKNRAPQPEGGDVIPGMITLEDYLQIHMGVGKAQCEGLSKTEGGKFEGVIYDALQSHVDEIKAGLKYYGGKLDIDLILRCGNQVGIAEVKTGERAIRKVDGIKQLNNAGRRDFLGTYTKKFLIQDASWDARQETDYSELASSSDITVIILPSYAKDAELAEHDRERLVREVTRVLVE